MPQIGPPPAYPAGRSGKHSSFPTAAEETASQRKRGRSSKVSSSPDAPAVEELDAATGMSQWRRRWLAKHSASPSSPAWVVAPRQWRGCRSRSAASGLTHSSSPSSPAPVVAPPSVAGLSQPKRGRWAKHSSSPSSPAPAGAPEVVATPAVEENLDAAAGMSQWRRSWLAKQSSSASSPAPGTIVAGWIASLRKRYRSGAESPAEAPSLRKRRKADVPDSVALTREEKGKQKTESSQGISRSRKGKKAVDVEMAADDEDEVPLIKRKGTLRLKAGDDSDVCFIGEPISEDEAKNRWPLRYQRRGQASTSKEDNSDEIGAMRHYQEAMVDGVLYGLDDCVYVQVRWIRHDKTIKILRKIWW